MADVTLRQLDPANSDALAHLRVADDQRHLVADVSTSLAEVQGNDTLSAFAVFDGSQRGLPEPDQKAIGLAVVELVASVGFVLRLLIDERSQGRGYGRATLAELVRRLRLMPEVEVVATSHRHDSDAMAALCRDLGFQPWTTPFDPPEGEIYLVLPRD